MIRHATIEDVLRCSDLAETYYHQKNTKGSFSKDAFIQFWVKAFDAGIGEILMRESDGKVMEAIGYVSHPGMSGLRCVSTMFWYVIDEPQGLATGLVLKQFLDYVQGIPETRVALLIDANLPHSASVLKSCGFEPYEMIYLKEDN